MSKALFPPFDTMDKHKNQIVLINSVCMFGYSSDISISFALLNGHYTEWTFDTPAECGRTMGNIMCQLGVIE